MDAHQYVNQDSGDYEYYTPVEIVEAARETMGGIDLDPASSATANKSINARHYFTEKDNALSHSWFGKVWLNHPFSRANNPLWIARLVQEWLDCNIEQACCITFSATSEKWFQPLMRFPQCFLSPRTNYYLPDGTRKVGVTKGSVVTYLGPHVDHFAHTFERLGAIKVPYHWP